MEESCQKKKKKTLSDTLVSLRQNIQYQDLKYLTLKET